MLIYDIFDSQGFDSLWHISNAPRNWFTWLESKRRQTDLDLRGSDSEGEKFMCLPPEVRVQGGKILSVNRRRRVPPSYAKRTMTSILFNNLKESHSYVVQQIWLTPLKPPTHVKPRDILPMLCKLWLYQNSWVRLYRRGQLDIPGFRSRRQRIDFWLVSSRHPHVEW